MRNRDCNDFNNKNIIFYGEVLSRLSLLLDWQCTLLKRNLAKLHRWQSSDLCPLAFLSEALKADIFWNFACSWFSRTIMSSIFPLIIASFGLQFQSIEIDISALRAHIYVLPHTHINIMVFKTWICVTMKKVNTIETDGLPFLKLIL